MKILKSVIAAISIATSLFLGTQAAHADAQMSFENYQIRLGIISVGQTKKFRVYFKNTGDTPLLIQRVVAPRQRGFSIDSYPQVTLPGDEGMIVGTITGIHPKHSQIAVRFGANVQYHHPAIILIWTTE